MLYVIAPYVVFTTQNMYVGSWPYGGYPWDEDPRGDDGYEVPRVTVHLFFLENLKQPT